MTFGRHKYIFTVMSLGAIITVKTFFVYCYRQIAIYICSFSFGILSN